MDKVTYRTTKSELVKVGLPEQTKSYKPISHEQLIELTLNSISNAGFELENEWYQSARDGQIATGHYTIKNIADKEMQLQIAWQNSMNKQVSLKFALGLHVFICSNGACSGDMGAFKRKHTGDVQEFTPKTIEEYIKTAGDTFIQMQNQRDRMKEILLTKRLQSELVGRMYIEEDLIESTQLNIIKRELEKPTYDYGAPNSMWELYQFTTFGLKDVHPSLYMKKHLSAHSFFVNESGLFVPKVETITVDAEIVPENQVSMFEVEGFVSSDPIDVNTEVKAIINEEVELVSGENLDKFPLPPSEDVEFNDGSHIPPEEKLDVAPEAKYVPPTGYIKPRHSEGPLEIINPVNDDDEDVKGISTDVSTTDYSDLY